MEKKNIHKTFDKIYKEFAKGIFRFIFFRVSDYEMAQDLMQDTFIRFWKQLDGDKEIENSKTLLYVIARGLIIDYYRKKKNRKSISIDSIDEQLLGQIDKAENELSVKQEIEQVFRLIKKIKKEYQEVLLFHYVEDLTISEIAFILNKKENTVRVLLHRAIKALKEKL